uniref:Nucleotidyltransferase domain-containing protein n=1 Tax=Candidatus Kentrum sp. TC TaxID=2126339 RepID=A0A451A6E5_9GAMM|nr:MAG: Nucleotidyltransferase domain-containing protein [Candidatus Kentron sp. TC]
MPGLSRVDAKTTEEGRVLLRFRDRAFEDPFLARYVSDGTIKMFAYSMLLHEPAPHSLPCVEEPENQLYPKLLWELAEEFRAYADRGGQIFVSAHSLGFLNAMGLDEVFWLLKEDGDSEIRRVRDDERNQAIHDGGRSDGGLVERGFFRGGGQMKYIDSLRETDSFKQRNEYSLGKIREIQEAFKETFESTQYGDLGISIFCAGSLGRGDARSESDLDLFILSKKEKKEIRRIDTIKLLANAININEKLEYPGFSNDGKYFKVYSFPEMLKRLGSPDDDVKNLFTVRMLLLLESRPIINEELYKEQIDLILKHYFRDSSERNPFLPLFLVNDILRYWRTFCLNYELVRNDSKKSWRKKNINLKFSRMLTIFGTIFPLISRSDLKRKDIEKLTKLTPMERLAQGLDDLGDDSLVGEFDEFINIYEEFIQLKEKMGEKIEVDDSEYKSMEDKAKSFSEFLYRCLTHNKIEEKYKRYLVL